MKHQDMPSLKDWLKTQPIVQVQEKMLDHEKPKYEDLWFFTCIAVIVIVLAELVYVALRWFS